MTPIKSTVEVWIDRIYVSKRHENGNGWYSVDWRILKDGRERKGSHDCTYSGQTSSNMRKKLKNGYAVEIALEKFFR